jgi:hypothetical protein
MAVQIPDAAKAVTSEAVLHNIGPYASAAIGIGPLAISITTSEAACCGRYQIDH